jgi:hypothetical protein
LIAVFNRMTAPSYSQPRGLAREQGLGSYRHDDSLLQHHSSRG